MAIETHYHNCLYRVLCHRGRRKYYFCALRKQVLLRRDNTDRKSIKSTIYFRTPYYTLVTPEITDIIHVYYSEEGNAPQFNSLD